MVILIYHYHLYWECHLYIEIFQSVIYQPCTVPNGLYCTNRHVLYQPTCTVPTYVSKLLYIIDLYCTKPTNLCFANRPYCTNRPVLYQTKRQWRIWTVQTGLYCTNRHVLYQPTCTVSTDLYCIVPTDLNCINRPVLYQPTCTVPTELYCTNRLVLYQPNFTVPTDLYCTNRLLNQII